MKKILNKWLIPICLLGIVVIQLIDYYLQKEINPAFIVFVIALLPATLKGLEYKISKKLEQVIVIFAGIGLIYVIWYTFF